MFGGVLSTQVNSGGLYLAMRILGCDLCGVKVSTENHLKRLRNGIKTSGVEDVCFPCFNRISAVLQDSSDKYGAMRDEEVRRYIEGGKNG